MWLTGKFIFHYSSKNFYGTERTRKLWVRFFFTFAQNNELLVRLRCFIL